MNSCFIDELPVLVKIEGLKNMSKQLHKTEINECVQLVVYGTGYFINRMSNKNLKNYSELYEKWKRDGLMGNVHL